MSKLTPPAPAAAERLTVNVKVVAPALPSLCETSLIERVVPDGHVVVAEELFRGAGATAAKSALLTSVSEHPAAPRSAAVEFESAGAGVVSEQFVAGL
jgi:hypothetical protein